MKRILLFCILVLSIFCLGMPPQLKQKEFKTEEYEYSKFEKGFTSFNYCLYTPLELQTKRAGILVIIKETSSEEEYKRFVGEVKNFISSKVFNDNERTYVLIPQIPASVNAYSLDDYQDAIKYFIDKKIEEGLIDRNKVYGIGVDMGGTMLYRALMNDKRAYAAVIIENGDYDDLRIELLKNVPICIIGTEGKMADKSLSAYNRLKDVGNSHVHISLYPESKKNIVLFDKSPFEEYKRLKDYESWKFTKIAAGSEGQCVVNNKNIKSKALRLQSKNFVFLEDVALELGYKINKNDKTTLELIINGNTFRVDKESKELTLNNEPLSSKFIVKVFDNKILIEPHFFSKYCNCVVKSRGSSAGLQVFINKI